MRARDEGGALGDAVAVKDGNADILEEVDNVLVKRRAAADDHLELAAEVGEHALAKELPAQVDAELT